MKDQEVDEILKINTLQICNCQLC